MAIGNCGDRLSCRALVACLVFSLAAIPAYATEVAVDVGHTLVSPGATSARGIGEFEFNRVLADAVGLAFAERGISVRPINFDGRIASLDARPQQAVGSDACCCAIDRQQQGELAARPVARPRRIGGVSAERADALAQHGLDGVFPAGLDVQ